MSKLQPEVNEIKSWLIHRIAGFLGQTPETIDVREQFVHHGLDSLSAARMLADLGALLDRQISPTLVWEYTCIESLAQYLSGAAPKSFAASAAHGAGAANEPIAIIGMACRLPQAPTVDEFWQLLKKGHEAITEVPGDRWNADRFQALDHAAAGNAGTRRGGFLDHVDRFDPQFFGISPREACLMDPQQRLMLELSWEALEAAGIVPRDLLGSSTGVFFGSIWSDYARLLYGSTQLDPYTVTGHHASIIANRVSYTLGLRGPSMTIDAACSSGLVSLHLGCQSLRSGESTLALVGGVNLLIAPESMAGVSHLGALSAEGRCYAFDARANGYVRGEGGVVIVLKRLSQAMADGDRIYCLVRGCAVNNDGASNGLTAPNPQAQAELLRKAYAQAGVDPALVQYVETHGTGTPLGDPIEAQALSAVFGPGRAIGESLRIGSAKTNVGHLEGAAGSVGIVKAALCLRHRQLVPSLNFAIPNPHIPFADWRLHVQKELGPWPQPDRLLLAGVSAFGLGGTNAHAVLEEWPHCPPRLQDLPRKPHPAIPALSMGEEPVRGPVFVCGGQGAQWLGMGRSLLASEPVFRNSLKQCDRLVKQLLGWSLLDELCATPERSRLSQIEVSLPAIIALQIAVADLLRSLNLQPAAVVGHSTGEIAAAHIAGVLSLEDTMRVICAYGRIIQKLHGQGAMGVIGLSWEQAGELLKGFSGRVFAAIAHSLDSTVVSGTPEGLSSLFAALAPEGVFCRRIDIDVAPHCPLVDSLRDELYDAISGVQPQRARIPIVSEVTGEFLSGERFDAGHFVRNFGDPAFFSKAIDCLLQAGSRAFLELSPHPLTLHAIDANLRARGLTGLVLGCMRRQEAERSVLVDSIDALGANGYTPKSAAGSGGKGAAPVSLLTLSAKTEGALRAQAAKLRAHLLRQPELLLDDVAYSLAMTRTHFAHRASLVASERPRLLSTLTALAQGQPEPRLRQGKVRTPDKLVFVFPGQGLHWIGMGRQLLAEEPVFERALRACDVAIKAEAGFSLLLEMAADKTDSQKPRIEVVQPMLFAISVGLAALWRSWGVTPDAVVGHSMGEVAAAHVAGVLSLEDAAAIICRRSRLLQKLRGQGEMAVVELPLLQAEKALEGYATRLAVAASNSPRATVLSGDPTALREVLSQLEEKGVFCQRVKVDVASHSPQVAPLKEELMEALARLRPQEAKVPMWSTVTGALVRGPELEAAYWADNLEMPVRFAEAVSALSESGHGLFIELSPHPTLLPYIEDNLLLAKREGSIVGSLRHGQDDREALLQALGAVWVRGYNVNLSSLFPKGGQREPLPTYPFERERYWVEESDLSLPKRGQHRGGHPLLGESLTVATQPRQWVAQTTVEAKALPWLLDHRVQDAVIFPGAGYLEMAFSVGAERFERAPLELRKVVFTQALAMAGQEAVTVQFLAREESPERLRFQIASRAEGQAALPWTLHAHGTLLPAERTACPEAVDLAALRARLGSPLSGQRIYAALAARGLHYGPAFQGLAAIFSGQEEALGKVNLPAVVGPPAAYQIHPALLDACLQVMVFTFDDSDDATWVPVEVDVVQLFRRPSGELFCHARRTGSDYKGASRRSADLLVCDAGGAPVVKLCGLVTQRLATGRRQDERNQEVLELDWELTKLPAPRISAGRFLLLGAGGGLGATLGAALVAAGHAVIHTEALDTTAGVVRALLARAFSGQAPTAVVHLGSLEQRGELDAQSIERALLYGCDSVLATVQALADLGFRDAPRLWLVTRGAQAVIGHDVAAAQAPLLGLGRVIALEHAELRCVRVDLDPAQPATEQEALLAELLADDGEEEIALRGQERLVARLAPCRSFAAKSEKRAPAAGQPFRLELDETGVLDQLVLRAMARRAPGPGEVEIAVEAAGLNFLDVLLAMGVMPDEARGEQGAPLRLGSECAGRIVAVGEGVTGLSIGAPVLALAQGAFASHVIAPAALVLPRPPGLSAAESAAIPVAYLTAYYALAEVARLERGERVLIHAATGGVGLAALQWARHVGAEVYATAGSPEKRAYLQSLGVKYVSDSRSDRFVTDVQAFTGGAGVDVVLNSLSGELIQKSFALLRSHGRFVELGKRDYYADHQLGLRPFLRNLSFSLVDLKGMMLERPAKVRALFDKLLGLMRDGVFSPPVVTTHPIERAAEVFRNMAQGRHLGKLVLTLENPQVEIRVPVEKGVTLRKDGSYLVTGGLGGLGLSVAGWLAAQGAGHLVLVGRSGAASAEQQAAVAALAAGGARVTVAAANVAERAQLERVLSDVAASGPPLRGVIHAAAVLSDELLLRQTPSRFRAVMAPKILGALHLDALTREAPLDFFVMYSSIAGLLGSPGQGNYAAANAFLDALAHHRRARGLPALSIDWGAFSEVGMAAAQENRGARLAARGIKSLTPEQGNSMLTRLVGEDRTQVGVVLLDVRQWIEFYPVAASSRMLSRLCLEQHADSARLKGDKELLLRLSSADPAAREALLQQVLVAQVSQVLRIPEGRLAVDLPLQSAGLDSLMGLELRNRIEATLGITMPATLLWTYPTVAALSRHLSSEIGGIAPAAPVESEPNGSAASVLEEMSDDELLLHIAAKFEELT